MRRTSWNSRRKSKKNERSGVGVLKNFDLLRFYSLPVPSDQPSPRPVYLGFTRCRLTSFFCVLRQERTIPRTSFREGRRKGEDKKVGSYMIPFQRHLSDLPEPSTGLWTSDRRGPSGPPSGIPRSLGRVPPLSRGSVRRVQKEEGGVGPRRKLPQPYGWG